LRQQLLELSWLVVQQGQGQAQAEGLVLCRHGLLLLLLLLLLLAAAAG
jgi:hypothetical protein